MATIGYANQEKIEIETILEQNRLMSMFCEYLIAQEVMPIADRKIS